jgi:hypothetical protein
MVLPPKGGPASLFVNLMIFLLCVLLDDGIIFVRLEFI